ncbi:MAG TPA: hypothetical protein DCX54_01295 [Flavobacteriales bacterium]|nr:hypothetical protein [Flavobacteriales bacterium]
MKSVINYLLIFLFSNSIYCQTCNILSDDYSNPSLWTKYSATGSNEIYISNGTLKYVKSIDGKEERVYRRLQYSLNNIDDWEIDLDFNPISAGTDNYSGHLPLSITSGNLDPLSNCQDPTVCGPNNNWTNQNQDGIIVFYGSLSPPSNQNINTFFQLHVKDNYSEWNSRINMNSIISAKLGSVYHLKLSKCGNSIELHVSKNGSAMPGSPITYLIPPNVQITGLNTIQHANSARGVDKRILTAGIDNLCVTKNVNSTPEISGINGINSTVYNHKFYSCEGEQCFYFYSKDANNNQSLNLNIATGLPPGAVFSYTSGPRPIGKICWDPGQNMIGVHTFQVEVTDDYCIPGSQIYTFTIEVLPGYNLGGPISVCNNAAPLSLPDEGPGIWTIGTNAGQVSIGNILDPSLYLPGNYTLTYCTPKPGCLSRCVGCWSIPLEILEAPVINLGLNESFCNTDAPRYLTALPAGGTWSGGPYINPNGLFDPGMASSINSLPGNRVTYTVNFPNGCSDSKSIDILVHENGMGMSYDLGIHCLDEYLIMHEGGYKYELAQVYNIIPNGPQPNTLPLPYILPGNTIHLGYLSNYINQSGNYFYLFKGYFKNAQGCEYVNDYLMQIVNCGCTDTIAQGISVQVNPNPNNLKYDFSFSPPFSTISNIERYKWVITDQLGNTIKTLNYWDNTFSTPGSSFFTYDFSSEFGTLFSCGYYNVYLQVLSKSPEGEMSLCQYFAYILICDENFEQFDVDFKKKKKQDFLNLTSIKIYPAPCENQSISSFLLSEEKSIQIEIFNSLGRKLLCIPQEVYKPGHNELGINCQELEKGFCVLRMSDGIQSENIKFLVK